jgi:hypothetical protein
VTIALALVAVIAAVTAVVLWADRGRSGFASGSFADIEGAVTGGGLQICTTVDRPSGQANQAVHSRQYEIGTSCPPSSGNSASMTVDQFSTQDARDAAVRGFEVQNRPRASGVAYTYRAFSIFVRGSSKDEVQDRLNVLLLQLGAR